MDKNRIDQLICDNMKNIFSFCVSRVSNKQDAEDLAGDIIYELLRCAPKLKDEDRFFGYMWRIARNVYADHIKSGKRHPTEELSEDISSDDNVLDDMILKEDISLLRRELSLLSEQYRTATILYYMTGLTCTQISEKMNVSVEMVKYYLFRARKAIKEGIGMERMYGEKSYAPYEFSIDFWGTKSAPKEEFKSFRDRRLRGNILLAAYYTPVTLQELSLELGVALPYLEDEVKLLEERLYLICKNGKYLTNIPVFTEECKKEISARSEKFAEDAANKIISSFNSSFSGKYGDRSKNENLMRWQAMLLSAHFALNATQNELGEMPDDGAYSIVNGGGGKGIVWGSCSRTGEPPMADIKGVYDLADSSSGRGSVIAYNFPEVLNSQWFMLDHVDPVVLTAAGCFDSLSDKEKEAMTKLGYAVNSKPNFSVYTAKEYNELSKLLKEQSDIFEEASRNIIKVSSEITAQHAPEHIKSAAVYTGAYVYQFDGIAAVISELFKKGWLKPVEAADKPAMCVVLDD